MKLPYVIDNQSHILGNILKDMLSEHRGRSLIVSWKFKHIVHFEKNPLYNAVNTLKGYGNVGVFSPLEVIQYES